MDTISNSYVLGINSAYHESSAALLKAGKLVMAVEEERFTRVKHTKSPSVANPHELPFGAVNACLAKAGIALEDVAHVGYSLVPEVRFMNTEFKEGVKPGSWGSLEGETLFSQNLNKIPHILGGMGFKGGFHWMEHDRCHAASAFLVSPFQEAAVVSLDGIGETASTGIYRGEGNRLELFKKIHDPHSLGFLWEKLCMLLGFSDTDACKVMGLAAYGDPATLRREMDTLAWAEEGGEFRVDGERLRFRNDDFEGLESLFGIARRKRGEGLSTLHRNLAAALQDLTNRIVAGIVVEACRRSGSRNLCLAGGVALNCVANSYLLSQGVAGNIFIQPAANDAGTALGAALLVWTQKMGQERTEALEHAYWGPSFEDYDLERALENEGLVYERMEDVENCVAARLAQGDVVGWFQGAMEFGPRALGNRSLLADPRNPAMRDILNVKVKHREIFRPFAPSVLDEEARDWFDLIPEQMPHEYMLMTTPIRPERIPFIPAVTHEDGTARIHLVKKHVNPRYHKLISRFHALTGVPLLLNTSFNDDEPIVCTPADAIDTFKKTAIDYLVLGDFMVDRRRQRGFTRPTQPMERELT